MIGDRELIPDESRITNHESRITNHRPFVPLRNVRLAVTLLIAVACDSATAPAPDFDIGRFPYVVSVTGVRHFGTSRLLVIPARFQDGAPIPLTAAELQQQLFGGSSGGPLNQAYSLASEGAFTLKGKVTSWVQ